VLDTNTLVSGFGWSGSIPGRVVDAALEGRFLLVTSPVLLEELRRVLDYPKLVECFPNPEELVDLVADTASVVDPQITFDGCCRRRGQPRSGGCGRGAGRRHRD